MSNIRSLNTIVLAMSDKKMQIGVSRAILK